MKKICIAAMAIMAASLSVWACMALAAQDRFELKALNGVAFSEIRGYEAWQVVAPSFDKDHLKVIVANDMMIDAYKAGIPGNGQPFPDGCITVKLSWDKRQSSEFPAATVPGPLYSVQIIMKDSKRFPATSGWGYARFLYDAKSDTFKPYGKDSSFGNECYKCHTIVKAKDFIFTGYAPR